MHEQSAKRTLLSRQKVTDLSIEVQPPPHFACTCAHHVLPTPWCFLQTFPTILRDAHGRHHNGRTGM